MGSLDSVPSAGSLELTHGASWALHAHWLATFHSPLPRPWTTQFSLILWAWLFSASESWIQYLSFSVWPVYGAKHNVFKVHECSHIAGFCYVFRLNYIPLYVYIILVLVDSSIHGYLGCSSLGLSAAAVNIGILIPLWDSDFNSFCYTPRSRVSRSYVTIFIIF
jgi:hypothetical protein